MLLSDHSMYVEVETKLLRDGMKNEGASMMAAASSCSSAVKSEK